MKKKESFINSNKVWIVFVLGFIIGAVGMAMTTDKNGHENHEGDHHATHDHSMSHGTIEVDPTNPPSVQLEVIKDLKAGWMVKLTTSNFRFAPENANLEHLENQGHGHLYINGEKITRLYSNYYYLGDMAPGEHEVRVTLNSNDHSDLTLNGVIIEDSILISQE